MLCYRQAGLLDSQPLNRSVVALDGPPFEYRGALHSHTTLSDETGSIYEVASIADRLDLDFLFVTDHNTLEGRDWEGRLGGCTILVGSEISSEDGHVLAFGTPETLYRPGGDGAQTVGDVGALGGMSVIAHPAGGPIGWRGPAWVRADGIEILNTYSVWRNAPIWKLLFGIPAWLLNRPRAMLFVMDGAQKERSQWDAYLENGPMTGLAGADSHGTIRVGGWDLRFPRYEDSLAWFPVHILTGRELTGEVAKDRQIILKALKRGSCYLSVGPIGPVSGFRFRAVSKGLMRPVGMGQSLTTDRSVTLVAELPAERPVRIVLRRNGAVIEEHRGRRLEHTGASPGVYRVEIYADEPESPAGHVPWVLSNPIRVNDPGRPLENPLRPDCAVGETLADFETADEDALRFRLEADPVTPGGTGPVEVASPGARGTKKLLRLPFAFPPARIPATERFWALVDRRTRNLEGSQGIAFYARSDKRFRFRFEIRETDAQGRMGEEYFSRTFLTTPEWRCVDIPFDKLRCIAKGGDGKLDPAKVSGIYFVADTSVLKLEASGTLWLDEIRAYPRVGRAERSGAVDGQFGAGSSGGSSGSKPKLGLTEPQPILNKKKHLGSRPEPRLSAPENTKRTR